MWQWVEGKGREEEGRDEGRGRKGERRERRIELAKEKKERKGRKRQILN